MHISLESPVQPEVTSLIAALDACQQALYPPASNHLLAASALQQPGVLFAVARNDGDACACGAVVPLGHEMGHGVIDDIGELKRMYVAPSQRRQGVGRALLAFLEQRAAERGMAVLRLETGIHQPEALRLYESAGYSRRGPFGSYHLDPLSVFMEKRL
jgi:putative acetyltransferase